MKSKTSFFNKTVFFSLYKRFWPIFAAYLGIWLITLPISLQNTLRYAVERYQYQVSPAPTINLAIEASDRVMNVSLYGGIAMSAIFAILISMAAYSYLYNARSVSMTCALPIKRESVFLTFTAAGILGMLISNVIVILITAGVEAAFGVLSINYLLQGFAVICLMNLFFFGFAALCASFTGHILVLPAVYVVLNFTASVVEFFVRLVLKVLLYGLGDVRATEFDFLSPIVGLMDNTSLRSTYDYLADGSSIVTGLYYNGWPMLIIYGVIGVVFALFAMLLVKNRHMETAGDVVAVKLLKPIFKYCMCIGCALVLGSAIYYGTFVDGWFVSLGRGNIYGFESMVYMLLFILLGAFIGYFAADMLMKKTLRVFGRKNWTGFIISAVIITGLVVGAELDVFGYERDIPELNEIEYAGVDCQGTRVELYQDQNIEQVRKFQSDIVSHKSEYESAERNGRFEDLFYVTIDYKLKNGRYFQRHYTIFTGLNDDIYKLTSIVNSDEAVDYRKRLDIPLKDENFSSANVSMFDANSGEYQYFDLEASQLKELYENCIVPDIRDGAMGKIWFVTDDSYYNTVCDCSISLELRERRIDKVGTYSYKYDYFDTTVTMNARRTIGWLEENLDVRLIPRIESDKLLYENMSPEELDKHGYEVKATN